MTVCQFSLMLAAGCCAGSCSCCTPGFAGSFCPRSWASARGWPAGDGCGTGTRPGSGSACTSCCGPQTCWTSPVPRSTPATSARGGPASGPSPVDRGEARQSAPSNCRPARHPARANHHRRRPQRRHATDPADHEVYRYKGGRFQITRTSPGAAPATAAPSSAGDDCAPHFGESKGGRSPQGMACWMRQNAVVAVGPAQSHIRDRSTSTSQPGAKGSKPCSLSQRTASRLRNDHHAWITSRSTSVP